MTDSQWGRQRTLAENIFKAYMEWDNASDTQKRRAKNKLCRVLATRSKYPESPRSQLKIRESFNDGGCISPNTDSIWYSALLNQKLDLAKAYIA